MRGGAFVTAAVLAGCAAKAEDRPPVPLAAPAPPAVSASAALPPPPPVPTLDELASAHARLAPGMRELVRAEVRGPVEVPKVERDTCVRAAFATERAASWALVAADHAVLATSSAATRGALDRDGPVCFHPKEAPSLVAEQDAGVARVVIWGAP